MLKSSGTSALASNLWRERDYGLKFDHSNVVRTLAAFTTFDNVYYVQELAQGGTLWDHLKYD